MWLYAGQALEATAYDHFLALISRWSDIRFAAMTLTQLRYLVAIADAGLNITLAAARVHATQPGLSKQLKQLEDELGFLLFARKGRSLEAVTPAGQRSHRPCAHAAGRGQQHPRLAANQRRDSQGQLHPRHHAHAGAFRAAAGDLARLNQQFPQVSVHLHARRRRRIPGAPGAWRGRHRHRQHAPATRRRPASPCRCIAGERVVLVPRGHALATLGRRPSLADLAAYPLVSYESSREPESSLRRAFVAARPGAAAWRSPRAMPT